MKAPDKWLATALIVTGLSSCSDGMKRRWYSTDQVERGRTVYDEYCATCHGVNAQGSPDWQTAITPGVYPPPPLDGSAHTWHHSRDVLLQIIGDGGAAFGGVMPAFNDSLPHEDKLAVLAFVHSHWSDEVYKAWVTRSNRGAP